MARETRHEPEPDASAPIDWTPLITLVQSKAAESRVWLGALGELEKLSQAEGRTIALTAEAAALTPQVEALRVEVERLTGERTDVLTSLQRDAAALRTETQEATAVAEAARDERQRTLRAAKEVVEELARLDVAVLRRREELATLKAETERLTAERDAAEQGLAAIAERIGGRP